MSIKIKPSQVVRTEQITTAGGITCTHKYVRLTPAQKAKLLAITPEEAAKYPPPKYPEKMRGKAVAAGKKQQLTLVLNPDESDLAALIDKYAAANQLPNRGAVLRVAIGQLLGYEVRIPHHGWQAGRTRKKATARKSRTASK